MKNPFSQPADTPPISVSELNNTVKLALENGFSRVCVEGEISNVTVPRSGHAYFSLKDEHASIRCVFFRQYQNKGIPQNGMKILLWGNLSLYTARGDFQLIANRWEECGLGSLQRAYEALLKKLHAEGLFDPTRKKKLPFYPKSIAVVTAPQSAAYQDVLNVHRRRFPLCKLQLFPTSVQGEEAVFQLREAICQADASGADIVLVCRGGGSLEDLWCFNDESVVRALVACKTPVITGVGHEIDTTLADFAADVRAPTPSAAVEMALPDQKEVSQNLDQLLNRLNHLMRNHIEKRKLKLKTQSLSLKHPRQIIQEQQNRLKNTLNQISNQMITLIHTQRIILAKKLQHLQTHHPQHLVIQCKNHTQNLFDRIRQYILKQQQERYHRLAVLSKSLEQCSPLTVLARGYTSITQAEKSITLSTDLNRQKPFRVHFADGTVDAKVIEE